MNSYKTVNTLNRLSSLRGTDRDPTSEEKNFVNNIELEIAKSILQDFGKNMSKKIAKVILTVTE